MTKKDAVRVIYSQIYAIAVTNRWLISDRLWEDFRDDKHSRRMLTIALDAVIDQLYQRSDTERRG